MRLAHCLVPFLVSIAAGSARAAGGVAPKDVPRDAECKPLPAISGVKFKPGEQLSYDIDVLAANAAHMDVEALPRAKGQLPIRVRVETNTFFNKVRRVKAEARSYLSASTLRPTRYLEDAQEDDRHNLAEVDFHPRGEKPGVVGIRYATNPKGAASYTKTLGRYAHDALDEVGAIYYIRSLDLKPGMPLCFDVYAMRHMFRVWGTVKGVEKVATPAGEFQAFHIEGTAARLDNHAFQRELHIWITADERRIPVGALGGIDLGPVRATLTHIGRADDGLAKESRAQGLSW